MARDINELHPDLQHIIVALKGQCEKHGLKIGIGECVRSVAEQDALYAQGRTKKGRIVTNAKGSTYSSMHQWGVAFDFYRNDGKGAYNDTDGFFAKVGKIGIELGLEWGGSWTSIVDKPHLQLPDWGSDTINLKYKYKIPDKFIQSWVDSSVRINKQARSSSIEALQTALNKVDVKLPKLKVNGAYDVKTQRYVLAVWESWEWNKDGKADGWTVGAKTINKLSC
jgi:peptidoglycan L-alanyl-D-glutamate endopeptidase CwlK